jgi:hypothetical protein
LILSVIKAALKPRVFLPLNYFAPPIARQHKIKNETAPPKPAIKWDWDFALTRWKAHRRWVYPSVPEPGFAGCPVPIEKLREHGLDHLIPKAKRAV